MAYNRLLSRSRVHNLALVAALITAFNMTPSSLAIGLTLTTLGWVLQIWSKAVLRRDRELCTRGPYAICRHPFYLANGLMDLGLCAMSGFWPIAAGYPLLFLLAYIPAVRNEERVLADLFPHQQEAYVRSTARFIPANLRLFRVWRSPLSWRVFLDEHQLSRSLRHASFPPLIILAARAWQDPFHLLSPANLLLTAAFAWFTLLGYVAYHHLERGSKHDLASETSSPHDPIGGATILDSAPGPVAD